MNTIIWNSYVLIVKVGIARQIHGDGNKCIYARWGSPQREKSSHKYEQAKSSDHLRDL